MGEKAKAYIEAHDATELLLQYMQNSRNWLKYTPYWISHYIYQMKSSKEWDDLSWWNIKNNKDFNDLKIPWTNNVFVDWVEVDVSDLWNFLIWYNWNYARMNLDSYDSLIWYTKWWGYSSIYEAWMLVERSNYSYYNKNLSDNRIDSRAFADEYMDRIWYDSWYNYAENEKKWKNESLWSLIKNANTINSWKIDIQNKLINNVCWIIKSCYFSH